MSDPACTQEQFDRDTATHVLETVRDDGLYRHLKFRKPGTSVYGFDIITWPGYLCITGDMGASVFSRLPDMFGFFRPGRGEHAGRPANALSINLGYWSEKLEANNGEAKDWSLERFRENVRRRFEDYFEDRELSPDEATAKQALWDEIQSELIDPHWDHGVRAYDAVSDFRHGQKLFRAFNFYDFWEYDCREYEFRFIWRCYAIAYAIRAYDAAKAGQAEVAHG